MNTKSSGLFAILLTASTFIGATILFSQNAKAQYADPCSLTENGTVIMSCTTSNTEYCTATLTIISADPEKGPTEVVFRCKGKSKEGTTTGEVQNPNNPKPAN